MIRFVKSISLTVVMACVLSVVASGTASAAPINDFEASFSKSTDKYVQAVNSAQNQLRSKTTDPTLLPSFADTFNRATGAGFTSSVWQANGSLKSNLKSGKYSKDVSRDMFVNSVNQAKGNYFNTVERIKNELADRCNKDGVGAPKDEFMNNLNTATNTYSNELSQMTNKLASSL